ncbi:MAG: hypothetical protein ACTSRG_07290 [Candidatus Helarchaeota archaeon]
MHLIFNNLFFHYYYIRFSIYPPLIWDWANLTAFYWQVVTFVLSIIPLASVIAVIICSKYSVEKVPFYQVIKIYLCFLVVFALYPLVNLFFVWLYIDPIIKIQSNFQNVMVIQIGQIIQGVIISVLSLIILYEKFKTKLGVFLSILAITLSFIFIGGIYPLYVYFIANLFFNSTFSLQGATLGFPHQLYHIYLWAAENILEVIIIAIAYLAYILQNDKNFQEQLIWLKSYSGLLLFLLGVTGYVFSQSYINVVEIGSLLISIFLIWSLIKLLEIYYEKKQRKIQYKSIFEMSLLIYFIVTAALSLALLVSFAATFFLSIMIVCGLIYLYLRQRARYKYLSSFFFGLMCFSAILVGSTPTAFSFFTIDDFNILLLFLRDQIIIPSYIDSNLLFYSLNLIPVQFPSTKTFVFGLILGIIISFLREGVSYYYEKSGMKREKMGMP